MSEKVTFQELVESIAEQTDHSKQFTHDFLKDFVAVINNGLENDEVINIAGFGKFKLRSVNEREGFNPRTKEKITIPAHKKVVFKPYKALRDLVNAPYAHLDPELIRDTPAPDASETGETEQEQPSVNPGPSLTPEPGEKPEKQEQAPWEKALDTTGDQPTQDDDPFGFGVPENKPSASQSDGHEEDDSDIVEYSPDIKAEEQEKAEKIAALIAGRKKTREQAGTGTNKDAGEDGIDDDKERDREVIGSAGSAPGKSFQAMEGGPQKNIPPVVPSGDHRQRSKSGIWIAAACLALLLAAGAWYYSTTVSNSEPYYMAAAGSAQQANDDLPQHSPPTQSLPPSTPSTPVGQNNMPAGEASRTQQDARQTLVIAKGQTLWSLADQEYNDPYLWPWIYGKNKTSINNPDLILVGQTLALPEPDETNGALSTGDSLQVAMGYVDTYRWYKNNGYEKAKYYLYAAKIYNGSVFDYTDVTIDKADLAFANGVKVKSER